MFVRKKFCVRNFFGQKKVLDQKKFWAEKEFGGSKKSVVTQNILVQKKFAYVKILVQQNFGANRVVSQEKFGPLLMGGTIRVGTPNNLERTIVHILTLPTMGQTWNTS